MHVDPYRSPAAPLALATPEPERFIEVTWSRAWKLWWSVSWRLFLYGLLGGAIAGFFVGFAMTVLGYDRPLVQTVTSWLGLLVSIPVGLWVIRGLFSKRWSDFQIRLVPVPRG